jgi:hypothetical protein
MLTETNFQSKTEKRIIMKQNSQHNFVRQETQVKGLINHVNIAEQLHTIFKGFEVTEVASKVLQNFGKRSIIIP